MHLVLVPDDHVYTLLDLPAATRSEFWEVLEWATTEYGLDDYGVGVRNGDPQSTAGTIAHVHAHLLAPNGRQALRMKFGTGSGSTSGT